MFGLTLKPEVLNIYLPITCVDNLKGFVWALETVFPQGIIQNCVVHQIRNSLKYVASEDQKELTSGLKPFYQTPNLYSATLNFKKLQNKWGSCY